jgi:hypothetical protein
MDIRSKQIRLESSPPTVDIKSKKAEAENSGNINLSPPSAGAAAKGN